MVGLLTVFTLNGHSHFALVKVSDLCNLISCLTNEDVTFFFPPAASPQAIHGRQLQTWCDLKSTQ